MKLLTNRPTTNGVRLAKSMGIRRIRVDRPRRRNFENEVLINWGCGRIPSRIKYDEGRIINNPRFVSRAINKEMTLDILKGHGGIPKYDYTEALVYMESCGEPIIGRKLSRSRSGRGVVLYNTIDELEDSCNFYTPYISRRIEYRVHVIGDEVVDITRKRGRSGAREDGTLDYVVRNRQGNWVYTREGVRLPEETQEMCVKAVHRLGLDFAGIDLVRDTSNPEYRPFYILEVNTAPGLVNTTLETYTDKLLSLASQI